MSASAARVIDRDAGACSLVDQLARIWSRVLRVSPVGPDSDFFELGGDSLLAVNLLLEVEREFGINLPITTIYDARTVGDLAELISAGESPRFSPLVLLKQGEGNQPLFIVHGIGGTVVELAGLAQRIAIPDAIYALQARGVDGTEEPLASVGEMAEYYLGAIREVQPEGPYRLCGYSFGGLVALEMARLLDEQRERPASLILIDPYVHPTTQPFVSRVRLRIRRALEQIRTSPRELLRNLISCTLRGRPESPRKPDIRQWLLDRNPNLPLPLLQVREAGEAALRQYVPQFYPGKIVFLEAAQRMPEFPDDPKRIWRHLVAGMKVHTIAGTHRSIVAQHAEFAAGEITALLRDQRI